MKAFSLDRSLTGVVSFLLIVFFQTSCLEIQEKPVNFGPEITPDEIIKALQAPIGKMHHSQIGQNEKVEKTTFVYYTNNPNGRNLVLQVENKKVIKKEKLADRFRYKSEITYTTFEDNKTKVVSNDPEKGPFDDYALDANLEIETVWEGTEEFTNDFLVNSLNNSYVVQSAAGTKVTFHGLQVNDGISNPPTKVKNKANCNGIPNCQISTRQVDVVKVEWLPSGPVRHDLTFIVSPTAPFFSKLLAQCDSSLHKLKDSSTPVLLTICANITDFESGSPWPAN